MDAQPGVPPIPSTPSTSRKRSRENETPSQRTKREKAAERQRRKRERDRQAGLNSILAISAQAVASAPADPHLGAPQSISAPPQPTAGAEYRPDEMTEEEALKRDKVRIAARERQRKHRALVKARKLRELGLDMGNEIIPGMDEVQYRLNEQGQYQPVLPHEMHPHPHPHPHPPPPPHAIHEPPFPQGQPLGGQTFASTLLLSFSCAPLLKAHLLRTLSMTNEELASLEPIIAQAWDHWDQQRRMHYAPPPPPPPGQKGDQPLPDPTAQFANIPDGHYVHDPTQANDFRARFHRPLVAPSPFRASLVGGEDEQNGGPASGSGPGPTPGQVLGGVVVEGEPRPMSNPVIDPQLGQARDEAADVATKLARS